MVEMVMLTEAKETDNKLRWDARIGRTDFSLYVPKWRVPRPWPRLIEVTVRPYSGEATHPRSPRGGSEHNVHPITCHLDKVSEHTRTIRYRPDGANAKLWELGEPYIPTPMTFDGSPQLTIEVICR